MQNSIKGAMAGALALAGLLAASAEGQAMPIQPTSPAASASTGIEQVWCCHYGWRRHYYGYGWRRPYGYGYGWRRPWGWHRWGWRRW